MSDAPEVASWTAVALLPEPPPVDLADRTTFRTSAGEFWECGDSGWDLMIGWLADPATLARFPDHRMHRWEVTEETITGVRSYTRPTTDDEQKEFEEDQNVFLHDMGLPADRPTGFRWLQRLPDGVTVEKIHSATLRAQRDMPIGVHPRDMVPVLRQVLQGLFRS
ncbi:DUF5956 family protein [Krasilnikovia cinnamomea]|nr:DUF5956 family protein [Krasilnikovia cinnamomea]